MPVQGGGGAPPFAVTGAGCIGQSAPSRRGCGGRPSARAAQSVASPLPAKDPSAELQTFKTDPFLRCLDPFFNKSLVQIQFCLNFGVGEKRSICKKVPRLTPVRGEQGKEETIGRN